MSKLYVGSEVGQLRRVLLNRPERALTHLTPSNCHDLLFDDVLAVEAAGEEHDAFAETLRSQDVEVLLLHDLLVETLAVPQARDWLLNTQISDFRYGPTFACDLRNYLAQMDNEHLATILLGAWPTLSFLSNHHRCCLKCIDHSISLSSHCLTTYLREIPHAGFTAVCR